MPQKKSLFDHKKRTVELMAHYIWCSFVPYVASGRDDFGLGKGVITYGHQAVRIGYTSTLAGQSLISPVKLINRYCLDKGLPRLNSLIVRQDTKYPGWKDMFPSEEDYENARLEVYRFGAKWRKIPAPTSIDFVEYKGPDSDFWHLDPHSQP